MCVDNTECNRQCQAKLHTQRVDQVLVRHALYGSLPGYEQTTPRAELMAIYLAIKYGSSPQRIICDHINHVNVLTNWARDNDTSFLNPKDA